MKKSLVFTVIIIVVLIMSFTIGYILGKAYSADKSTDHPYGCIMEVTDQKIWLIDMNSGDFFSIINDGRLSYTRDNQIRYAHQGDFVSIKEMTIIAEWTTFMPNGIVYDMYDRYRATHPEPANSPALSLSE